MAISYTCDEKDESLYNSFIKPRLKSKEPARLFCSFTYITPNYINLFIINELAKLAKEGYELFLVIWDMNSITNKYFKRQIVHNLGAETPSSFMDKKVGEVERIFSSLGAGSEKLHIYKSSDVWKRMVTAQNHDLFLKFYHVLASLKIADLKSPRKASHLIQMPADIFFANFLHLLYPEDTEGPMDIAFLGNNKEEVYKKTRQLMYDEGIIGMEKPVFLITKHVPYIILDESVPEWNMSLEEIIRIFNGCKLQEQEIVELFEILLKGTMDTFYYYDTKGNLVETDQSQIIRAINKLPIENKMFTLGYNLYKYMNSFKAGFTQTNTPSRLLNIKTREQLLEVGAVIKSKPLVEMLHLADGTKTISQIAKLSKKQIANASMYISNLKKAGLITVDSSGKVRRAYDAVKINFANSIPPFGGEK
ncbi:MAG: helix-turn-helix domain-containing protein [Nanoarchaeota archaeon]|nr:helix-turn-helix domain-containing protein [Nanoarchaeota archaeon]